MAVFRIGELAHGERDLRAAAQFSAPADLEGDELGHALAVLGDLDGQLAHQVVQRGAESGEARIGGIADPALAALCRCAGGKEQAACRWSRCRRRPSCN